jgi:two-component system sensor histidine kinase AgrC
MDYLRTAQSDLDAFTPIRYCENETAKLPETLPLSETKLCSLFSNSLENVFTAVFKVTEYVKKAVTLRAAIHQGKLLLSVENPYAGDVVLKNGLPQSSRDGHGYGTLNITTIAESHGGQALFSAKGGIFSMRVMLPVMAPCTKQEQTPKGSPALGANYDRKKLMEYFYEDGAIQEKRTK